MTPGSHCEETYRVSDAEGRKHAACEKGGTVQRKERSHHEVKLFKRNKQKVGYFKTYSTQFTAPFVTRSHLGEGGRVVMIKSLGILTAQITGLFVRKVFK